MSIISNQIFLGCNYSNKRVKEHFDTLKEQLEKEYPVQVIIIDREKAAGSLDIWGKIKQSISSSSLAIFDVSAFRPNVVLELGYALATISQKSILIAFDERCPKGEEKPVWLLSDISHLQQVRYKVIATLRDKIHEHLSVVPIISKFQKMCDSIENKEKRGNRYKEVALKCLIDMRDSGSVSDRMIEENSNGTTVDTDILKEYMRSNGLAKRGRGRGGRWTLHL